VDLPTNAVEGGGFGMFSTVDDESARFLRCYLVTGQGDLPLSIPSAADKIVAELRAAPSQADLQNLADRLAKQAWRWRDQRLAREAAAVHARQGLLISAASLREPAEREFVPLVAAERVIEPIPQDESEANAIPFHAARVECWRYRYNAHTTTLDTERVLTASAEPKP